MANRATPFIMPIALRIAACRAKHYLLFTRRIGDWWVTTHGEKSIFRNPMQKYNKKSSPAIFGCFAFGYYNTILMERIFRLKKLQWLTMIVIRNNRALAA